MIVALEIYDEKVIAQIAENEDIGGAVLGDLFCNYRMFPNADAELPDRMKQLKAAGKKVFYQTPCYLTDSVFGKTLQNIRYWNQQGLLDGVLLQDVGLLRKLGEMQTDLTLIWSFMGESRNRAVNLLHYRFLQSLADVTIATDQPQHWKIMQEHAINSMLMYGRMTYATVNRLCYYTYENNLYETDCKRACLQGSQHMINEKFHMNMSVDGYMLGKKYLYTKLQEMPELLYAQNYEECLRQIQILKEREKK
ncbi:MAG: hypothetical protein ACI4W6_01445 [Acutalibacteraceae bacterium]